MELRWWRAVAVALVAVGAALEPHAAWDALSAAASVGGHAAAASAATAETALRVGAVATVPLVSVARNVGLLSGTDAARFEGRRFLVTGASSGIGRDVALQLCARGGRVALAARRLERLHSVRADCLAERAKSGHPVSIPAAAAVVVVRMDAAVAADREAAVQETVKQLGGLDVLVLNAGIGGAWTTVANLTSEVDLRRVMEVNYWGYVGTARAALPALRASPLGGHIVAVTSMYGLITAPFQAGYCGSKHALHGFFDTLREELRADGIGVTVHSPGGVRTEVQDKFRTADGRPARMSIPDAFLASSPACASSVLYSYANRQQQAYYPPLATAFVGVRALFPAGFDWAYHWLVDLYLRLGVITVSA